MVGLSGTSRRNQITGGLPTRAPTEPGDAADLEEIVRFAEDSEFASPMLAPVDLGDLVFPDL